jgi:predicted DNA-binding protein YlxM (UPF0122 family)
MKLIYKDEYNNIINLYLIDKKSLSEIRRIYNVKSDATIYNILKKNNIKFRNRSESLKLSFNNRDIWNKGLNIKENKEIYKRMYNEKRGKKISEYSKGKKWEERYGKDISKNMKEKISKNRKGKKFYNSGQFKKEDIRLIGERNPNWNGGLSFEQYDKYFNNSFKNSIRKRDNQICILCGIHREKLNRALDIHHINYNKMLSIQENCIALCTSCHMKTNGNRKNWTKFFQDLLHEKYGYEYSKDLEPIVNINRYL